MARGHIQLCINGQPHEVSADDALLSLSDYLRLRHHLVGTKIVCSEGDCGACSVLVARLDDDAPLLPIYRSVDACITWMFQLDHAHVVTIEGLEERGAAHAVQEAMIACHGSQCGFCTPGFVMATVGLLEAQNAQPGGPNGRLDESKIRLGLTGNLCRCTGYVQICNAARSIDPARVKSIEERYPAGPMRQFWANDEAGVRIQTAGGRELLVPASLNDALDFLARNPKAKIVAGATDVGVAINKGLLALDKAVYTGRIAELAGVRVADGRLRIGAAATWSAVERVVKDALPEFAQILARFGAPQIRHAGTVGGNVINASPIADSLPLFFVCDARLRLVRAGGAERTVRVDDFYLGYKKLDIQPGELLAEVELTLPQSTQVLRLYKVSKRRDLDISTFTAAVLLSLDGGRIDEAKIAYGGVGPVVLRLPRTEAFLAGKVMTETLMAQAGAIARQEIAPISDVRSSAEYRLALAETILLKFFFDHAPAADAAGVN